MLNALERQQLREIQAVEHRAAEIVVAHKASGSLFMSHEDHYEITRLQGRLASSVPFLLGLAWRLEAAQPTAAPAPGGEEWEG